MSGLPGICPACGAHIDLVAAAEGLEVEALVRAYAALGERADLVRRYVAQFAAPGKALRHGKHRRLVEEVAGLLRPAGFEWRGKKCFVTVPTVVEALEEVAGRHFERPLTNHNYLKQVAMSKQERRRAAEEEEREARRRRNLREYEPPAPGRTATPEERKAAAEQMKTMAREIGVWRDDASGDDSGR